MNPSLAMPVLEAVPLQKNPLRQSLLLSPVALEDIIFRLAAKFAPVSWRYSRHGLTNFDEMSDLANRCASTRMFYADRPA